MRQSSEGAMRGYQAVSREWMAMSRDYLQTNLEGMTTLMRCRSMPEFVAAQNALVRQNLELAVENGCRLAELSVGHGGEAARSADGRSETNAQRASRAG